ncbi:MAG: hypothetical protein ACI9JM_001800 [Halioglobus sp.]|jgi:hypothetical protein
MIKKITASLAIMAMAGWANSAGAGIVIEAPGPNSAFGSAQALVASDFTLTADPRIEDENGDNTSTFIPHAEIFGTGDDSYDIFSFMVGPLGAIGIFDIDCAESVTEFLLAECPASPSVNMDSEIWLYDAAFTEIAYNDDGGFQQDTGSVFAPFDSFIQIALAPGTYYIEVGDAFYGELQDGQEYILNVSIGTHRQPTPAPGVLALLGLGLAGIGFSRRKKQK